ncbi:HNH endonuclease [Novosphingobium mangrovi (ex Huang et al. 2023)]|uniref:HNH endonuclease n=1 Tax=Novosphingobium mangrovi (ex Huang et al. 2023) TaxID=2976432 RepID=A0ABT2I1A7_9SPHN|nr:HNH endonuclease [Novosphingobium mangrovi (ex Huang et al. 2023)]MCT2398585.1 HNH endonuclease [Novosphingobium mangrovi (ex Huang et al. 2023)]
MKYKRPLKITSRTSSVTNGFVQAILPDALPDREEHGAILAMLEQNPNRLTCVYCGDPAQHWDHLNPYVKGKRPSGYLNEARNLVPACGPCNTSKSGHDWRAWMFGNAKGSPATRGIPNLNTLAARIDNMVALSELKPIDLRTMIDPELWNRYWSRLEEIEALLIAAQREAAEIQEQIAACVRHSSGAEH